MNRRDFLYFLISIISITAIFTKVLIETEQENESLRAHIKLLVETCSGQ